MRALVSILFILSFFHLRAQAAEDSKPDSCYVYIPNNITENCCVYGCEYLQFNLGCKLKNFHIIILNRWGEIMYESTDQEELWNPFHDLKEKDILIWEITGEVANNKEFIEVKWHGLISVL
jgi:hypothetical protein